jgi:hypothetical protein
MLQSQLRLTLLLNLRHRHRPRRRFRQRPLLCQQLSRLRLQNRRPRLRLLPLHLLHPLRLRHQQLLQPLPLLRQLHRRFRLRQAMRRFLKQPR